MATQAPGDLTRTRSRSTEGSAQKGVLEPQLLRAAENDDVPRLREIVETARAKNQLNENLLRIGLMRSSEKGKIAATEYLLSEGAKPDGAAGNRLSPLLRAVERNNIAIVQLLLAAGANRETRDKKGRTALMTAAWKNHRQILSLLIAEGADVNGKDNRRRNVLHNLGADKQCDWDDQIIHILLDQEIHIDGFEGQDELKRTPLHWACATGKIQLAELFLTREKGPRAYVDAVEYREKTSLHLAAAHDRNDIVEMLLKFGSDVNAKSDGGWTPLHNACETGSEEIVSILLEADAEINGKLLNGMSPLHLAAQGGHLEVVRLLLARKDIKRAPRDTFGFTPFLRAAQNKRKDIVSLLAPVNQVEALSEDALGASNGFSATIVDFGDFRNENRVKKHTVYELLYGKDPINPRKPAISILPKDKATKFRWIHLPANNMAWVESLLTKSFVEEGASDVEGFKELERSFSHQHRGQQVHSHFMRPLCQSTTRAPRVPEEEAEESSTEHGPPVIVINGTPQSPYNGSPKPAVRRSASSEGRGESSKSSPQIGGKENVKPPKDKGKKVAAKVTKSPKIGTETPTKEHRRKPSYPLDAFRPRSSGAESPGRKVPAQATKGNIFTFMPYLHFETTRRRQEMQKAIKRAEKTMLSPRPKLVKATTYDEMLIRAHLATSTVSLHVRRTLDQSFYHNIDTGSRDMDQVVYRYQLRGKEEDPECDPKVLMVDQLWMWILGKDLIVTSFPQRWQQPKNDPLNVLDSIIEDINSKTRDPVKSVYDLSMIITNRCSGVFNRHRMGDEEYQFLDMFESSIGNATDRETILFKEFNSASAQASAWLQHHRRPNRFSRYIEESSVDLDEKEKEVREKRFKFEELMRGPLFIDKLLDIGQETDLLAETKDIRDELNMIAKVLEDQLQVLPDLQASICQIYLDEQTSQRDVKRRFEEQLKSISTHIKDIERMDKQAERIYKSITDMLDLKQKHANAFEARFTRDQAAGTARQGQTIMVFTIVTIVFLPLSFIAAFFTINIQEFPRGPNGSESLPLAYVSKFMFGVGFAISIPLIAIALALDDIGEIFRGLKRKFSRRRERGEMADTFGGGASTTSLDLGKLNTFSMARSGRRSYDVRQSHDVRRSHDVGWERPISRDTNATVGMRAKPNGFRIVGQDIERGLHAA